MWEMKTLLYLLAATALVSATVKTGNSEIDGVWMGIYRSETLREKVAVKFSSSERMEFFTGGIIDHTSEGSYHLFADSISFIYQTTDHHEIQMLGRFNRRMNLVSGVWKMHGQVMGNFYLEKQKMQELMVEP
jgi:hypothetical protein